MRSFFALAALAYAVAAAGCSDPDILPKPTLPNAVDTLALYAVSGTDIWRASGYSATERRVVRLDQSTTADFAYQITPDGRRILLPGALVGQASTNGVDPGLRVVDSTFDELTFAPTGGYLTLDTVDVAVGTVFYLKGRVSLSCFYGYPTYGKGEILTFDDEARAVLFRVLVNGNCGYRSLEPGLPKR
ncbi:MAG TPA: hypothetical protein VF862_14270 [Gemmatimonadales bacterium]